MPPFPSRRSFLAGGSAAVAAALATAPSASAAVAGSCPTEADVTALSATEVVAAIRCGRMSAVDYVTVLLKRAERFSDLNAVITLDREGAMAAARRVDQARRRGRTLGELAGLPILVKDNINVAGLPNTGGTPALRDFHPATNAPVLQRLLDAGAFVLGKANMHELAFGTTTTNFSPFAGFAHNPYDRTRVPGGSSGGTATAISARLAPVGLGTDTGGSVRIPAAYTGIAGLRPSTGNGGRQRRWSTTGVLPLSATLDTVGPLGRTVADIALLDAVVTGSGTARRTRLRGLRMGVPAVLWQGLDGEVAAVAGAARDRLACAGVELVDVDLPSLLDLAGEIVFPLALHEPLTEIPRYLQGNGLSGLSLHSIADQIASPDVRATFSSVLSDAQASAYPHALNVQRPQIQRLVATYFQTHHVDALLFPTTPILPPVIDPVNGSGTISVNGGPPVDSFSTSIRNMGPGSCVGMPGLSLPAGLTRGGIPVGISLEGPIGSDRTLLSIGQAVESLLGTLPAPAL